MHKNNNMMLIFNRKKRGNYQQKKKSHQLYDSHIVSDSSKCGLWVPTKEHQTRVQTFPIFPKGFQVLT